MAGGKGARAPLKKGVGWKIFSRRSKGEIFPLVGMGAPPKRRKWLRSRPIKLFYANGEIITYRRKREALENAA
jgi:hypothetical protein